MLPRRHAASDRADAKLKKESRRDEERRGRDVARGRKTKEKEGEVVELGVAERETERGVSIVDDEGGREGGKETRGINGDDGEREPRRQGRGEQRPAPGARANNDNEGTTLTRRTLLLLQSEGGDVLGLALGLETRACFEPEVGIGARADQVGAASRQHRTKRDGRRDARGPTLGGVGGGCETVKDAGGKAGGATALPAAEPDG
ncbi:hypothetical protein B0H14DRAFT_2592755 [Mycena olivaceomarginata]|nr:hypothetical protein B0H14DRAFT_2592755 [Mycena olivaceomarginata]